MEQTSATNNNNSGSSTTTTSVATHLAGANKVNSVNFSTCLHRLARFASSTNNNNIVVEEDNDDDGGDEYADIYNNQRRTSAVRGRMWRRGNDGVMTFDGNNANATTDPPGLHHGSNIFLEDVDIYENEKEASSLT